MPFPPFPAAPAFGPRALAVRQRAGEPRRACRSLLIWRSRRWSPYRIDWARRAIDAAVESREGALRVLDPCNILFFPSRAPLSWATNRLACCSRAALHNPLVNISENTSAGAAELAGSHAGTDWILERKWRARGECSAARARNNKAEQARRGASWATRDRSNTPAPAGPQPSRPPTRSVDPCRCLLIASSPARARSGARIVKACRSLLIRRIRPRAEPVRSGEGGRARHGQSRPCPAPSPPTESGERP
jgi:hypothetical protein